MNYVEWLRVRNALRIFAIVLGALLVIALIVRISVNGELSNDQFIVDRVSHDPGTVTTHSIVNGLNRTTIYNAHDRTTITIDDQNNGGKLIRIVEPASGPHDVTNRGSVGPFHVYETQGNGMETITFNTDGPVNFEIFLAIGGFAALIFATIWGCSFAGELGHLEYAALKPVTRTRYAFGVIGVDIVGMAIAAAMTIVAAIVCLAMFEIPHFDFSRVADPLTALLAIVPLAWYAMLNAATASMRRGYGAVIGFAWPVALVVISLSQLPTDEPVSRVLGTIFLTVSRLIPLTYLPNVGDHGRSQLDPLTLTTQLAIVTGLTLIYGALTIVQWRRVEA